MRSPAAVPRRVALVLACCLLVGVAAGDAQRGPWGNARRESAFRAALESWAAGDEAAAIAALRQLDSENGADAKSIGQLKKQKLEVAQALGRRDRSSLVAIVRLEERVYRDYALARQSAQAVAARQIAEQLIADHVKASGDHRVGAALLVSLAGSVQQAAQDGPAASLYRRALELVPRQPAALLGLSAMHEKRGEYAVAVDLLEALESGEGDGVAASAVREARLRLAINRIRLGRVASGEALLRGLAERGNDWIRSVAAQELARTMIGRGEVAAAAELLRRTMADVPCDPSLPVMRAMVEERAGRVTPFDLSTQAECGEAAESARARYGQPPVAELNRTREQLAANERGWRTALSRALAMS